MGLSESKPPETTETQSLISSVNLWPSDISNPFQTELNRRRQLATEKYNNDLVIHISQQTLLYDTDEFVDQCVAKLKNAALQAADERDTGFYLQFDRFMKHPKFSGTRLNRLEDKIILRIVSKFCAETGFQFAQGANRSKEFTYLLLNDSIMFRGNF